MVDRQGRELLPISDIDNALSVCGTGGLGKGMGREIHTGSGVPMCLRHANMVGGISVVILVFVLPKCVVDFQGMEWMLKLCEIRRLCCMSSSQPACRCCCISRNSGIMYFDSPSTPVSMMLYPASPYFSRDVRCEVG
jgi:hypothetical protein